MELTPPKASVRQERVERASRRVLWLLILALPMLLFLSAPLLALVLRSPLQQLATNLLRQEVAQAVQLSLSTTMLSTLITLVGGTPVAYLLARYKFRGRGVLDTLIDLPMILPPAVAGLALLITFGRRGLLGAYLEELGVSLAFTQAAVVLAQIFVASPYYIKAAISGFGAIDRKLEQAAAIDGADGWRVFQYITIPLAWPALFGGIVMTWARALGEFGATIIFAGNFPGRTQTMPLAIYIGLELDLTIALTLSTIMLAISFLILFVVKGWLRQRVTTRWE